MLVIEIALGVLIALLIYRYILKNERNKEINKEKYAKARETMESYMKNMKRRIEDRFINYLGVFGDRMLTLEDDEKIKYSDAAMIEFKIFMEQSQNLCEQVFKDEEALISELNLEQEFKTELMDEMRSTTKISNNTAQRSALKMMEDKLLEIANSKC